MRVMAVLMLTQAARHSSMEAAIVQAITWWEHH